MFRQKLSLKNNFQAFYIIFNHPINHIYLILIIGMFSTLSFANVDACRTALDENGKQRNHSSSGTSTMKDLDALIAELDEIDQKQSGQVIMSPKIESANSVESVADQENINYQSMMVNELLSLMGIEAYQMRLAAAEILKQYEPSQSQKTKLKVEIQSLLNGIVNDTLSVREKKHLHSYKKVLLDIIQKSRAVQRFEVLRTYDNTVSPQTVSDLFESQENLNPPPPKKFRFKSFFGISSHQSNEIKIAPIPYENAEQFARALSERSINERVEIIRLQTKNMSFLSHLELYRILMAIPVESQLTVYHLLKPLLIGRIDFYPMNILSLYADFEASATLDIIPVSADIIFLDLIETGVHLDLWDLFQFLKMMKLPESEFSKTLKGRSLSFEKFSQIIKENSNKIKLDEMLLLALNFIDSYSNIEIINQGRNLLKEVYVDTTFKGIINNFFNREIASKDQKKTAQVQSLGMNNSNIKVQNISAAVDENEKIMSTAIDNIAELDWNGNYNNDDLLTSIRTLVNIHPKSIEVQTLRIQTIVKALESNFTNIKKMALSALQEIIENEHDPAIQKLILVYTVLDWNSFYEQNSLLEMIQIVRKMKPENHTIEQIRIKYLGRALNSVLTNVRNSASDALRIVSESPYLSEINQLELLRQFNNFDWNTIENTECLVYAIKSLGNIQPANEEITQLRMDILVKALNSTQQNIRTYAVDMVQHISREESVVLTQELLFKKMKVNWSDGENIINLLKLIEIAKDLKPLNSTVIMERIEFLGFAQKSNLNEVRKAASSALQMVMDNK